MDPWSATKSHLKNIGAQCNTTGSSSLTASTSTAGASISAKEPILRTCSGARVSSECKVGVKVVGDVHGSCDGVDCCGNSGDMSVR